MTAGSSLASSSPARRFCTCEARIASSVLDGYSCGKADCWRTEAVRASFAAFVAELIRERGDVAPIPADQPRQA